MNIQGWFPLGWTDLISLQSKGLSRVFSNTTIQKHQFFDAQPSLWSNTHIHTWPLEKPYFWLCGPLLAKWCLCFLIHCLGLSQLSFQGANVFKFQGCSHHLQWLWSPKNKVCHCLHCLPIYLPWSHGTGCHNLHFFEYWILSQLFHFSLSPLSRVTLVPLHFLP